MKKYYLITLTIGMLLILLTLWYWHSKHNLSFTCTSSTASFSTNVDHSPLLNFSENITLTFGGQAFVNVSGELHHENNVYIINRTIIYDYSRLGNGQYQLHAISMTKTSTDSVPANLVEKYLGQLSIGSHRVLGVRQLPSGDMVISNTSGPYIVCAVH